MKDIYDTVQPLISHCYQLLGKPYTMVGEKTLRNDLSLIDEYLEITTDVFLEYGLQKDWEPNTFGLQLEEVINCLLKIRYEIVR